MSFQVSRGAEMAIKCNFGFFIGSVTVFSFSSGHFKHANDFNAIKIALIFTKRKTLWFEQNFLKISVIHSSIILHEWMLYFQKQLDKSFHPSNQPRHKSYTYIISLSLHLRLFRMMKFYIFLGCTTFVNLFDIFELTSNFYLD